MANQSGNQTRINLTDGLILNKNKCAVTQFSGFKKRNSPYYNGGVAPMYETEKTGEVIDKDGNVYTVNVNTDTGVTNLYKNGELLSCLNDDAFASDDYFNKEVIEDEYINSLIDSQCFFLAGGYACGINYKPYSNVSFKCKNIETGSEYEDTSSYTGYFNDSQIYSRVAYLYDGVESAWNWVAYVVIATDIDTRFFVYKINSNGVTLANSSVVAAFSNRADLKLMLNESTAFFMSESDFTKVYVIRTSYSSQAVGPIDVDSLIAALGYTVIAYKIVGDKIILIEGTSLAYNVRALTPLADGTIADELIKTFSSLTEISDIEVINNKDFSAILWLSKISGLDVGQVSVMNYDLEGDFFIGSGKNEDGTSINCKKIVQANDLSLRYGVLINNNKISGLSIGGILVTPWLDVDTDVCNISSYLYFPPNDLISNLVYYSRSRKALVKIIRRFSTNSNVANMAGLQLIDNRYLVVNKGQYNCYDLRENKVTQFAPDWNNRAYLGFKDEADIVYNEGDVVGSHIIASGACVDYERTTDISSALFNPIPLSYSYDGTSAGCIASDDSIYMPINVYIGEAEKAAYYRYTVITKGVNNNYKYQESLSEDTTYPITTDGNILLSPSIFADFYETKLLSDYIKENGVYYNLVYTEGEVVLLYPYGTGVRNAQESFVIQGQRYVIRNRVICAATISDGLLTVGEGIVNVGSLLYIGCLPSAAYFYSPATECLMAFTGDRLLSTVFEATEIEAIVCSDYSPNSNALYIASADAVYSLFSTPDGNSFIYKIECAGVTAIKILNDGTVAFKVDDNFYIYSIYPRNNYDKIPVELSTEFYGYGENRVSVIDSWYIRLYSEEAEEGTLILKVESITDGSTESETKTVRINKTDWDSNGFYYYRYQPQIQRGVGVSLSIKSDFTVYDLQASYSPDSTLQLTSRANTSNNANTF